VLLIRAIKETLTSETEKWVPGFPGLRLYSC
jgi:hypothetical protein